MEPKLSSPERGPQIPAVNYGPTIEQSPGFTPESMPERRPEQLEQRAESTPQAPATAAPVLPMPVVAPTVPTPATAVGDDLPAVANDDDLIEKEWVDKAKKIIAQTKDDPYLREQEVAKLQADYLRKRYGRELGAS